MRGSNLCADLFLILNWEGHKLIIFRTDQKGYRGLVEASALPIPFLNAIQGALASQVEHEQDRNGVVADKGEHVDEFALTTQIPY